MEIKHNSILLQYEDRKFKIKKTKTKTKNYSGFKPINLFLEQVQN